MSVYRLVLDAIFVSSAVTFIALFFRTAPYGRHLRGGWGIALSTRRAWFLMEFPSAAAIFITALTGTAYNAYSLFFLALWEAHYLYRSLVYPRLVRGGKTQNMPWSLIAMAVLYNVGNGYVNGFFLFHSGHFFPADWYRSGRFIVGVLLFMVGMAIHLRSDAVLRSLRKPGEHTYSIPRGGLFELISSPNYFGEIIQWTGFAVATWSIAGLSFAVFTFANLAPRALSHHRWYRETFADYPEKRRALIPLIL